MQITLTSSFDVTVNDALRIQAAINAVESSGGGLIRFTGGYYYLGPVGGGLPPAGTIWGLLLGSNVHLWFDLEAVLVRRFSAYGQATIATRDYWLPMPPSYSNVRITGGTIKAQAHEAAYEGTHLSLIKVQDLSIQNVRFEGVYNHWNASFVDCQDVAVTGVVMNSGTELHEDGLHFVGGARIVVSDCDIRCGDDALALTQENFTPLATTNLTDFTAVNCYLQSAKANAFKAYVASGVARTISRVRLANIVGKGGVDGTSGLGIGIRDDNGANRVSEIEIDGFTLDASDNQVEGLKISGASHVRLANVTILQPKQGATIDGSEDVELRNLVIDRPQTLGQSCLNVASVADCTNIRILGGRYSGGQWQGIELGVSGGAGAKVTGFEVSGALIEGAKHHGLALWYAVDGIVVGNTITGSGSAGPGYGVAEVPPSSNRNLIIGNWLANNASGPVIFAGLNTEVVRNFGTPLLPIADSGGFRQTIDGWGRDDVAANITTPSELSRYTLTPPLFGRFRAAREGSVTGIVIRSTAAVVSGSITVTVFKNTGALGATPGTNTGFSATLDTTNQTRHAVTQATNLTTFGAGDELYLMVTTTASLSPTNNDIRCDLEIED